MLSTSVANAIAFLNDKDTEETEKFIRHMDTFFDCLNVRSLREGDRRRKPNLQPYRETTDERFKVIYTKFATLYVN